MDIKDLAVNLKPLVKHPDEIFLDIRNPRFFGENFPVAENADPLDLKLQERVRSFVYDKFDVKDLMDSIQQVGFLTMDRIVVRAYKDKFIVLEGNRRLTAIKTLLISEEKKEISLSDEVKKTLTDLQVLHLDLDDGDYREAAWFLQGIRHISGIKDWGPYQQAELVHTLMQEHDLSFTDAGKAIGAGRKKTGQMLRAYRGLKQMERDATYGDKAYPDLFSHFEQAWAKAPLREWMEWDDETMEFKNHNALSYFYKWITEDNPITNQGKLKAQEVRDKLPLVVKNDNSRKKFIQDEFNLDTAFGVALVEETGYKNWHNSIKNAIDNVQNIPWSYEVTEEDADLLNLLVGKIKKFLESKRD
jgi:hypothetical protein